MPPDESLNPEDLLAKLRADAAQSIEATKELAKQMSTFYFTLLGEDLDPYTALQMTMGLLHAMMQAPRIKEDDDDGE